MPHDAIRRIVMAMIPAIFLAAIDGTVVSVALLTIGRELRSFELTSWVVAGYLVSSTVATPIYGKLSDLHGRRPLLLVAIAVHLGASVLCGLAQDMHQLIAFRILQGLGSGGLLALAQATIADLAPGPQRGRYQGYLAGTFATAAISGPILGGLLTEYLSWRAIFWINLPIGALALWLVHRVLPGPARAGVRHAIDYLGALLLAGGLGTLLIGLTRIGQGHGWTEGSTLALFGLSALLLMLCALQERRAEEPLLPPEVMRNPVILAACAILGMQFFVMISAVNLLPMRMQAVGLASAQEVALRMLPMTLATPAGAFSAGQVMLRTGHYRIAIFVGTGLTMTAQLGLALAPPASPWLTAGLMLLLGYSLGLTMSPCLVAAQMSVPRGLVGVATSTTGLCRSLGGAIGVATLTSLLFDEVRSGTAAAASAGTAATSAGATAASAGTGRTGMLELFSTAPPDLLRGAFEHAFLASSVAALIAFAVAFTLPAGRLDHGRH